MLVWSWAVGFVLSGLGALLPTPAWGIYRPCTPFYDDVAASLPVPLNIPHSAGQGDPITPWMSSTLPSVFSICLWSDQAPTQGASGSQHYLYVRGEKGPLTKEANLTVSVDGTTWRVFTNDALEAVGVGYIARWRVVNGFGTQSGQWRTLQAGGVLDSPVPASAGIPFWRNRGWYTEAGQSTFSIYFSPFASFADWLAYTAGKSTSADFLYVAKYGVEFEVRYVMLVDANTVWNAELDPYNSGDIQVNLVTIRPHPEAYGVTRVDFRQTFKVNLMPYGTCQTPSWDGMTVPFPMLFPNQIPAPGDTAAEKSFDLAFTRCPRIDLKWFVHANNKWVNTVQGIVGLSGSTPHADPIVGNPRGFGIQLLHNGGQHGFGLVGIGSSETDPDNTIYTHSYPGVDAVNTPGGSGVGGGVTHTLRLRARIIRTHPGGTPITTGPFNTLIVVAIRYP